jgi:hypothetical protein
MRQQPGAVFLEHGPEQEFRIQPCTLAVRAV